MGDYGNTGYRQEKSPKWKEKDTWGKVYGIGSGGIDQELGLMPSNKDEAMARWNTMWGKPSDEELDFNKMLQGEQADIAKNLLGMTQRDWKTKKPIMNRALKNSMDFMSGNNNIAEHPWYEPNKSGIENQYQDARESVIANQAVGGGLNEGLADVEMGRAQGVTDLMGQIIQDEYNKAFGLATGAPAQTYGGMTAAGSQMGQAAGNYNQYIQQQQQNANQNAQTAGAGLGTVLAK